MEREPMLRARLYEYLDLDTFSKPELERAYQKVLSCNVNAETVNNHHENHNDRKGISQDETESIAKDGLTAPLVTQFLLQRIPELEEGYSVGHESQTEKSMQNPQDLLEYAQGEARKFMLFFPSSTNQQQPTSISEKEFVDTLLDSATSLDVKAMWPITLSILLVGISVGVSNPAMPFVVAKIGISPGQYGTVVSSFALAKMLGNIPFAILVERHGRKPYLVSSLVLIALGVGGIGAATSFEQLYACRLLTGFGVAALTTASQLMVTDISTPLNRAVTQSPIVSAFAAGTALGPAFGGFLVDYLGVEPTFYLVGTSYLGVALVNKSLLQETKRKPYFFPWQEKAYKQYNLQQKKEDKDSDSIVGAVKDALGQWVPLWKDPQIRRIMIMNGFYWFSLSGSQMTLLPLLLTDPSGLNMSASGIGQVYMSMSLVQVMSNPFMARYLVDRVGKAPSIGMGTAVISSAMFTLPTVCHHHNFVEMMGVMGIWALGSSMLSTAPLAYITDLVDEEKRAQAIAMLRTSGDVGFLLGASCIGELADVTGDLSVAMQSSGSLLFAATLWFTTRQVILPSLVQVKLNADEEDDKEEDGQGPSAPK